MYWDLMHACEIGIVLFLKFGMILSYCLLHCLESFCVCRIKNMKKESIKYIIVVILLTATKVIFMWNVYIHPHVIFYYCLHFHFILKVNMYNQIDLYLVKHHTLTLTLLCVLLGSWMYGVIFSHSNSTFWFF